MSEEGYSLKVKIASEPEDEVKVLVKVVALFKEGR